MKGLIEKELRALLPYIFVGFLSLFVHFANAIFYFNWSPEPFFEVRIFHFQEILVFSILCFFVGQFVLNYEFKDNTINFLDSLPVSRKRVFIAKIWSGFFLILFFSVGHTLNVFITAYLSMGRNPMLVLSGYLYSNIVFLTLSFVLGTFFARFGDLGVGILFVISLILGIEILINGTTRRIFEPFLKLEPGFYPSFLSQAVLWGGSILVALGAANFFIYSCSKVSSGSPIANKSWAVRPWTIVTVTFFMFCVFLGNSRFKAAFKSIRAHALVVHKNPPAVYQKSDQKQALQLLGRFDAIDKSVQKMFPHVHRPKIQLELLPPAKFHAGYFSGTKIRVAINEESELTLAHELAHAYSFGVINKMGPAATKHTLFFLEGLASWAAAEALQDLKKLDGLHDWAGAIAKQDRGQFEELFTLGASASKYDSFEVYPLGTLFVESLVHVHGADSILCVLRQIQKQAFAEVEGQTLWNAFAARCKLDFNAVEKIYSSRLTQVRDAFEDPYFASNPPILFGQIVDVYGFEELQVTGNFLQMPPLVCRFRQFESEVLGDLDELEAKEGKCQIPISARRGNRTFYQLGYRLPKGYAVFFPWRELNLNKGARERT